jgi:hypothetical protein
MRAIKKRASPKAGSEFVKKYKGKMYNLKVIRMDQS